RAGGQIALVSDAGDPVLAQWQYGLGRVVAWTSDAKGQWARDWVGWSDFARFWAQTLRWTTGTEAGGALQPRVGLDGGTAKVTVDATSPDGQYLNGLNVSAVAIGPNNITSTVKLRQSAAGRYEGEFPATEEGAYLLRVGATGGESNANLVQTLGLVVPYSPEYRGDATDNGLLARLAGLTGGRALDFADPDAAFEHTVQGVRTTTDLWPLLLLLAILLLPFDIGVRRVRMTRTDLNEWLEEIRRRLRIAPRQSVTVGAGRTMETPEIRAMMGAKSRVRDRGRPASEQRGADDNGVDEEPHAPSWVSDLQSGSLGNRSERPDRTVIVPKAPAAPLPQPDTEGTEEESLATKLRRARERR
ncbi:MAG: glutamine amidotransferase, partial [Chloroflexia bacterium]